MYSSVLGDTCAITLGMNQGLQNVMLNSECAPYVKLHIGFRETHCKEKAVREAVVGVGSCCGGLPCSRLSQLPAVSGKQVLTKTSEGWKEGGGWEREYSYAFIKVSLLQFFRFIFVLCLVLSLI